jgi:microcystin-dependent protein
MKKISLLFFFLIVFSSLSYAQVSMGSMGFNYSALVRDTAGRVQPLKPVTLRFTLLLGQNGTSTNSPWIETQNVNTDAYGFVNVTIGNGTKSGGTAASFTDVDFSMANYWILIEVYNNFSKAYDPLAKQAFQAVPYAKVAGALAGGAAIPAGTIVAFGGEVNKIPQGWIICDGRELDNTDPRYQPLFNAIGYSWGTSNNANKFKVPFTLGMFLRGTSNGYPHGDPDRNIRTPINPGGNGGDNVGSFQTDVFSSHNHGGGNHGHSWQGASTIDTWGGNVVVGGNGIGVKSTPSSGIIISTQGGNETRPKNVSVNYIIKL